MPRPHLVCFILNYQLPKWSLLEASLLDHWHAKRRLVRNICRTSKRLFRNASNYARPLFRYTPPENSPRLTSQEVYMSVRRGYLGVARFRLGPNDIARYDLFLRLSFSRMDFRVWLISKICPTLKMDFQSSNEAIRSSLWVLTSSLRVF